MSRRPFLQWPIRAHLLALVVIMVLPAIGIIVHSGITMREEALHKATVNIENLVYLIAKEQETLLAAGQQLTGVLARLPEVAAHDVPHVEAILHDIILNNPQYADMGVIDLTGNVWAKAYPVKWSISVADRRFFQNVIKTGRFSTGEYAISRLTDKPIFNFGYPIKNAKGNITGAIGMAIDLSFTRELLQRSGLPPGSTFLLIDHQGTILTRGLERSGPFIGKLDRKDLFQRMVTGPDHATFRAKGLDNRQRIITYRKLQIPGESAPYMYVRSSFVIDETLAAANTAIAKNLLILIMCLLAGVLLAWFIGKHAIVGRVMKLQEACQRITRGDMGTSVAEMVSGGELGELAQLFDHMAKALVDRERDLRASESRYRDFAGITSDYIYSCLRTPGNPYRFEWIAGSFEKISGYTVAEIIEKGCWLAIIHPDDRQRVSKYLDNHRLGETTNCQFRIVRKDGTIRYIDEYSRSMSEEQFPGQIRRLGASQDITERKLAEQEIKRLNNELEQRIIERTRQLQSANQQLAESNRELESFCYSVSHDLRAPLRHIHGFSNILMNEFRDKLDTEALGYLERVCGASNHMGTLIDDLLQLSRVSRSELNYKQVDLSAIALETIKMFRESIPDRKVTIDIADGLNAKGDETLLRMVIQNLLDNAWKYTSKLDSAVIEFGKTVIDGKEAFFVRDNGVGFDMCYKNKLFGAFQRLHKTGDFEGTGIGLATVQKIIQRHGGTIWGEGKVSEGATFYFSLP